MLLKPKRFEICSIKTNKTIQENKYLTSASRFCGTTPNSLLRLVYRLSKTNKIQSYFCKRTPTAAKDRPYVSTSFHQFTDSRTFLNRITAFNATKLNLFFNHVKTIETNLINVFLILMKLVQIKKNMLASKGLKEIAKTTSVVWAAIASEMCVPRMYIVKRKRTTKVLIKVCNGDIISKVSDSGCINKLIFHNYLPHFSLFVIPINK